MMRQQNIGSDFDDFLQDEAMLEESTAVALKRMIAWQITEEVASQTERQMGLNELVGALLRKGL